MVTGKDFSFDGFGQGTLVVPIVEHIAHVVGDGGLNGVEGVDVGIDQNPRLGLTIGFEGDQFHTTKIRLFPEFLWVIGFGGWDGKLDFCADLSP